MEFLIEAFLVGLLGSYHCLGMCGPITMAINPKQSGNYWINQLLYHFGRIATYMLIGIAFGSIGKGLYLAGLQQRISILTGLILLATIFISKAKLDSFLSFIFEAPYRITKSKFSKLLGKKGKLRFVLFGILNGILPCGLVYMALLLSFNTADLFKGAFVMFAFGIGTMPALMMVLKLFKISQNILGKYLPLFTKVFTLILGMILILRGFGIGGYFSPLESDLNIQSFMKSCIEIISIP